MNIDSDIETIFSHLIDSDLIMEWLCPKAIIEPKVGGKYELYWSPSDPDPTIDSTHGCSILALDRPYMLNIEWLGTAEQKYFMNYTDPLTNVTFILYPLSNKSTKISLIHTGWQEGDEWDEAYGYYNNVWYNALKALKEIF